MATLRYFSGDGAPKLLPVHKPLMVIGRGSGNDLAVSGDGVLEHHAQIVFNGRDFQIEELDRNAEISINGKRKRRARLVNGDRIKLGSAELIFSIFSELGDMAQAAPSASVGQEPRACARCSSSANA